MDKTSRLAINLLKLCFCVLAIYSVGSSIYISYQQVFVGNDPTVFVSGYHWVTFGMLVLFFLPLLCTIYHLSKKSNMEKVRKVVKTMIGGLLLLSGLFVLCIVLAYAAPEWFMNVTSLFG